MFTTFLVGSYVIPVIAAIFFAFRRQWTWVAAATAGGAAPHQLMGLTSTCTQGADGTFGAGAILSGPLLLIAVGATLRALHWRKLDTVGSWVTMAVPSILLVLTQSAWINTLRFGTPCGEEFAFYGGSSPMMIQLIVAGYLVLPLLLVFSAAGTLIMAQRLSAVGTK